MSNTTKTARAHELNIPPFSRKPKGYIYVEVEREVRVDLDDIADELTDEQLEDVLQRRKRGDVGSANLLAVYEEFVRRGDAPQVLKDYIYEILGRVL